jgi:hypothetical protein
VNVAPGHVTMYRSDSTQLSLGHARGATFVGVPGCDCCLCCFVCNRTEDTARAISGRQTALQHSATAHTATRYIKCFASTCYRLSFCPLLSFSIRVLPTFIIFTPIRQLGARGGAVVEALRFKPVGHKIDSRWCHWNFSLT